MRALLRAGAEVERSHMHSQLAWLVGQYVQVSPPAAARQWLMITCQPLLIKLQQANVAHGIWAAWQPGAGSVCSQVQTLPASGCVFRHLHPSVHMDITTL